MWLRRRKKGHVKDVTMSTRYVECEAFQDILASDGIGCAMRAMHTKLGVYIAEGWCLVESQLVWIGLVYIVAKEASWLLLSTRRPMALSPFQGAGQLWG